jgi:hypothetical protein
MGPPAPPPAPAPAHAPTRARQSRLAPPSSSQLFNRLPSVADLDGIRLDAEADVEAHDEDAYWSPGSGRMHLPSALAPALELVPPEDELARAVEYFVVHVNAAFPVLYEPSLRETAARVCGEREKSSFVDVFTVLGAWRVACGAWRGARRRV